MPRFWNGDYATAMDIAKKQVEDGAHLIDIKVDDGMFDGISNEIFCKYSNNGT